MIPPVNTTLNKIDQSFVKTLSTGQNITLRIETGWWQHLSKGGWQEGPTGATGVILLKFPGDFTGVLPFNKALDIFKRQIINIKVLLLLNNQNEYYVHREPVLKSAWPFISVLKFFSRNCRTKWSDSAVTNQMRRNVYNSQSNYAAAWNYYSEALSIPHGDGWWPILAFTLSHVSDSMLILNWKSIVRALGCYEQSFKDGQGLNRKQNIIDAAINL